MDDSPGTALLGRYNLQIREVTTPPRPDPQPNASAHPITQRLDYQAWLLIRIDVDPHLRLFDDNPGMEPGISIWGRDDGLLVLPVLSWRRFHQW